MSDRWIRVPADRRDTVGAAFVAGVLAVGVGAVAFYVTRLMLAREPLEGGRRRRLSPGPENAEVGEA